MLLLLIAGVPSHSWNLGLRKNVSDSECDNVAAVLEILHSWAPTGDRDSVSWKLNASGNFTTKSTFLNLTKRSPTIASPMVCIIKSQRRLSSFYGP